MPLPVLPWLLAGSVVDQTELEFVRLARGLLASEDERGSPAYTHSTVAC